MVELVLTFCLLTNANSCIEQRPVFEEGLTSMSCLMLAQQIGAKYLAEHQAYRFSSWRCETARPAERAA